MDNSFILYTSYNEILQDLTMEEMGYIFKAILEYKTTGKIIDLPKSLLISFRFIKNQLDLDNEKYNKTKEARSKAGKNHKGNQYTQKSNGTKPNTKKQNGTKWNKMEQMEHNENVNVNVNENDNENVNEKQIEQPKQPVAVVPKKVPQQRVFDYFADKYKALTGFKYKSKSSDFVNLAKLIKDYGEDKVNQKIDWLEVGCVNRVFWFAKESGVNSFTIGNLVRNWNEILPQYTKEQLQEMERKRQEEETMKRVLLNAQKLRQERESWKNE